MPEDNEEQRRCMVCGEWFSYNADFFRQRNFDSPKRCPQHAAEHRNRPVSSRKRCLLQLDHVQLDIPDDFVTQKAYMSREDHGEKYITCCKFKLRPEGCTKGTYFTVYDHRNKDKNNLFPLSGDGARASLRIMLASQGYEYLVLDVARGKEIEAALEVTMDDQLPKGGCLLYRQGYSTDVGSYVLRRHFCSYKWMLKVMSSEDSLGDKLCKLLHNDM